MENNLSQILEKVADLYCKYGIKSVTMDDVAKQLGISKKTLYIHFRNKEDMIMKTLKWRMDNPLFTFRVNDNENDNAIDRYLKFHLFVTDHIKSVNTSLEYDLSKYYPEIYDYVQERRIKLFQEGIEKNLSQGVKEELFRPNLDLKIISKMLVHFYLNFWKDESHNFTTEEKFNMNIQKELTRYHLHGICSEKGNSYLKQKTI